MARPVALVTGASGGIGLELARLAARHGHDLVLVARSADKLAGAAEELTSAYGVDVRRIVVDLADDLAMVQLNVAALVELTGHLLPPMIERGSGAVLNLSSTAGFVPGPLQVVYFASKAFVRAFSEGLTEECRGTGVRVTALCPGPVDTGFSAAAGLDGTLLMSNSPMKVSAADVAAAGWDGLQRGRATVVPGLLVKLAMQSLRFVPRRAAALVSERGQRR